MRNNVTKFLKGHVLTALLHLLFLKNIVNNFNNNVLRVVLVKETVLTKIILIYKLTETNCGKNVLNVLQ